MKKAMIFTLTDGRGKLNFYIVSNGNRYFLFTQGYTQKVFDFYKNGVPLDRALSFKNGKRLCSHAMCKVSEKLIPYIRFVERMENVAFLNKTKKYVETAA